MKVFLYPLLPNFRKSIPFLQRITGFAPSSFWYGQHVDEDEYAALVE
jgi:hypothetical protein